MGLQISFFSPFTFIIHLNGVRVGTFKYFSDKNCFLFRQSDVYCMSAAQLMEVAEALKDFDPDKHTPKDESDDREYSLF